MWNKMKFTDFPKKIPKYLVQQKYYVYNFKNWLRVWIFCENHLVLKASVKSKVAKSTVNDHEHAQKFFLVSPEICLQKENEKNNEKISLISVYITVQFLLIQRYSTKRKRKEKTKKYLWYLYITVEFLLIQIYRCYKKKKTKKEKNSLLSLYITVDIFGIFIVQYEMYIP